MANPKGKKRTELPESARLAVAEAAKFMRAFDPDEEEEKKLKPGEITETEKKARAATKALQETPQVPVADPAERRAMRMARQGAVAGGIRLAERTEAIAKGAKEAFKPGAFGRPPAVVAIGEQFKEETRQRAKEEPFIKNLLVDTAEVIGGVPMAIAAFTGPAPRGMTEAEFGRRVGRDVTAGVVGGVPAQIGQVITEPITSFTGRPLSTGLVAADIGRVAGAAGRVAAPAAARAARAARTRVGQAVGEKTAAAAEAVSEGVHRAAAATEGLAGKPIVEAIPQVTNVIDRGLAAVLTREGRANIAAHLADGARQLNPQATAAAHAIMTAPERAVQELRSFGYRLSKQAAKRRPEAVARLAEPGAREQLVSAGGLGDLETAPRSIIEVDPAQGTATRRGAAQEDVARTARWVREAEAAAERRRATAQQAETAATAARGGSIAESAAARRRAVRAQEQLTEAMEDLEFTRREQAAARQRAEAGPLADRDPTFAGEAILREPADSGIGAALADIAEWGQRHGLDAAETQALRRIFADAAGNAYMRDAAQLAALPGVAKKVAQAIADELGLRGNKKFVEQLTNTLKESAGGAVDIRTRDGRALPIEDIVADLIGKQAEKKLIAESIDAAQTQVASYLEDRIRLRGLTDESTRVPLIEADLGPEMTTRIPDPDVIAGGETLPIVLPDDVDTGVAAAAMRSAAETAPDATAAAHLRATAKELDSYRVANINGPKFKAAPLFADALEWQARAQEAFQANDWLTGLVNLQKRGLVPRSLKAIINNFGSNTALQTMVRADPFVVPRALWLSNQFLRKFRAGEAVSPQLTRAFKALERTGLVDSNRLAKDIGNTRFDPLRFIQQPLEALFQFGDNLFKIEDFVHNFTEVAKYLDDLEPGRTMADEGDRGMVRFTKDAAGTASAVDAAGRALPVEDALGQVSAVPGRRKFIDYGDQTRLGAKLRGSMFKGMGSGFYTWMAGVTDIPFVKKGLGYRLLAGPIGVVTDSPAVNRSLLLRDIGFGMRRAMLLTGSRSSFLSREAQKEAELGKFNMGETILRPIVPGKDESQYMRLDSWNYLQPSLAIARMAAGLYAAATGAEKKAMDEMAKMTKPPASVLANPESIARWWTAQRLSKFGKLGAMSATGQLAPASAILDIIGLSGAPIMSIWEKVKETEDAGKVLTTRDAYKLLGPAMFGSGYANLFGTIADTISGDAPVDRKKFVEWAILTNLGLGWRTIDVAKQLANKGYSFRKKLGDEWKASLGLPGKRSDLRKIENELKKLSPQAQMAAAQYVIDGTEPPAGIAPDVLQSYRFLQKSQELETDIEDIKDAVDTAVGKLMEAYEFKRLPPEVQADLK